jgi:hypothetical protein
MIAFTQDDAVVCTVQTYVSTFSNLSKILVRLNRFYESDRTFTPHGFTDSTSPKSYKYAGMVVKSATM